MPPEHLFLNYNIPSASANASATFNEAARIDASGNLLVGTTDSAPAVSNSEVGVALSGSLGYVAASRSAGASGFFNRLSDGDIVNFNKDGSTVGSIATTSNRLSIGSNDVGLFFDSTNERVTPIDQANQTDRDAAIDLGYASSRFKDLYLSGTANAGGVTVAGSLGNLSLNTSGAEIHLSRNGNNDIFANGGTSADLTVGANRNLVFRTGSSLTERARLDSSGNLLVGKTSADTATVGAAVFNYGMGAFTRASSHALDLNRTTSDGAIINFRKDNTTVGSIGSYSSVEIAIGTGDTGLRFSDSANTIVPHNMTTNAARDAAVDLGYSTIRYKDLYLSGGVIPRRHRFSQQAG